MSGFVPLLVMSGLLGAGSFGIALLPLSFSFSKLRINQLSTFGTGLLLGAALGIIIPEGIETLVEDSRAPNGGISEVPTSSIAITLLLGFTFMLIVEQFIGHSHSHSHPPDRNSYNLGNTSPTSTITVDPDLELDLNVANASADHRGSPKAFPLTLGLVVHALADGFALGAAALPSSEKNRDNAVSSELSLVVFFALIVHKAPASLALTASLLPTNLTRSEIQKHLAVFAASTPMGAIATYLLLGIFGSGASWTGFALLFSGGTFLYVATVLQSVSSHTANHPDEPSKLTRLVLLVFGMFLPHAIGKLIEHSHGYSHTRGTEIPGGVTVSLR